VASLAPSLFHLEAPFRAFYRWSFSFIAGRAFGDQVRPAVPMAQFERANQGWAMDFVADGLATGRTLRVPPIVDSHTREYLLMEVDSCLSVSVS
jgi:hypothetical protein